MNNFTIRINKQTPTNPPTNTPTTNTTGTVVPNTGVYTAYNAGGGIYYLIVPPCTLDSKAKFWIRDGETRYSYQLKRQTFEQGMLYPVNITAPTTIDDDDDDA